LTKPTNDELGRISKTHLQAEATSASEVPVEDAHKLLHELQVYQIELEMQNETLREARDAQDLALHRYTELFDFAPIGYFILDSSSKITQVNVRGADLLGLDRLSLTGRRFLIYVNLEHRVMFSDFLAKAFDKGEKQNCEISLQIGKKVLWFSLEANVGVTTTDCLLSMVDITAKKEEKTARTLETEASQEANLTKSRFLAAMHHEIRTPMAGVIGMSDLLLDSDLSPQQLDWATRIKSSGTNLMSILNEILDQSKLEAGKLDLSPNDFHLPSFVRNSIQVFEPGITSKGLTLDIKLDDDLPEAVHADSLRIGQVLSNLLSNALKFTGTGRIEVNVKPEPNEQDGLTLRFTITDSGIGLTDEEKNELFNAFTQADSSTSRTYGGTGLGLSISKQLVELMGGQIGVDSTKGIGSAFWFTVSCQPAKEAVVATDSRFALNRWGASRPLKILVAEDDIVNQHIIRIILIKLGHSVEIAEDGKCAIDLLLSGDFDIILMDIRMPVMDGLVATATIRAMDGPKSSIPIIAVTADNSGGNITEYTDVGINYVCGKPIDLPILLKTINKSLDEEIHTSTSHVSASEKRLQPDEVNANAEESGAITNFDRVLLRVANIID
jgi:PAS domain S-box-containing protein